MSAPPVTVADLIGMTLFGSDPHNGGCLSGDCAVVSPDGSHVAVVVQRGNLERNTVDFAILVFRTSELRHAPKPDTVATLSSSSNRLAIEKLRSLLQVLTKMVEMEEVDLQSLEGEAPAKDVAGGR